MRRIATVTLALLMAAVLSVSALGEGTALDAFNALLAGDEGILDAGKTATAWLDEILAGQYADAADPETLAAALEPMAGITGGDIAAYASAHDMKVSQVRNAYYKALANALSAEIRLHPATEEKYRNVQSILALFLETEADAQASAEKEEVRSRLTPDASRILAEQGGLPVSFVEFIIMDEDWDDEDWENDEDWRAAANWSGTAHDGFEDIVIGSRDEPGSTRIADMQALLIGLGYLNGKADGVFGPRTQRALMEFQLANGMKPTGSYTAADYDKLRASDAVARWDYDDDFWDSEDLDTYNSPNTPDDNTPDDNTPDRNTRNTPDNNTPDRNTRNTPDRNTNNTPDRNTRNTPDRNTRNTPDRNTRNTPESPDTTD